VLCITHLASIAAYADAHFVVEKQDAEQRTVSIIRRVESGERIAELARMLTGAQACRASAKAARELLAGARARNVRAA
jgi:DNA repair protein RecN (Recombination protein N)